MQVLLSTFSPIKPARYFDGELTDGESIIRMVGFYKSKLEQLKPFCVLPGALRDCVLQRNKYKDTLEIVLKSHKKVEESTMAFEVQDIKTAGGSIIHLSDTRTQAGDSPRICDEPQRVGENKIKQDVTVADSTGRATLTLWDKT